MSATGPPDPPEGPERPGVPGEPGMGRPFRLRDNIGIISGIVLGLIALAALVIVAAAGDPGAFGILVVIVIGIALIFFGGQLHGPRGRRR